MICLRSPSVTEGAPAHSRPVGGRPVRRSRSVSPSSIVSNFSSRGKLARSRGQRLVSGSKYIPSPSFSETLAFRRLGGITSMLVLKASSEGGVQGTTRALCRLRSASLFEFFTARLDARDRLRGLLGRGVPGKGRTPGRSLRRVEVS